ncbi:hypothetical protein K432DRAFT_8960 [Lepidopterella palustris CBS 459.81]|uniref:F-box domain-containing protein n=1 Tax=Lepidopterella palustris CBS 459.81 TaxID=1314670 RepID=A0A8E2JH36_9PEZI|nr:hypothetical protein K432DRAFT_8960 [Lepidopterella palustris CBS 459.81]
MATSSTFRVSAQAPSVSKPSQTILNFRAYKKRTASSTSSEIPESKRQKRSEEEACRTPPKAGAARITKGRKKSKYVNDPDKPTRLRTTRPVQAKVVSDVWALVLEYLEPAQLLVLKDTSAVFREILTRYSHTWKSVRASAYGDAIPDPIEGLNEFQYSDLREGKGCQSCRNGNTRKTYWAFLRRFCRPCFESKIVKAPEAVKIMDAALPMPHEGLIDCVPSGIMDSWGNFVGCGTAESQYQDTVYLRSDLAAIAAEYQREFANATEEERPERMKEWYAKNCSKVIDRFVFAKKLEAWERDSRHTKAADSALKKKNREDYYTIKAAEMTPPLSKEVLICCSSYKKAIKIAKAPHINSWLSLKPKLEEERIQVEASLKDRQTSGFFVT